MPSITYKSFNSDEWADHGADWMFDKLLGEYEFVKKYDMDECTPQTIDSIFSFLNNMKNEALCVLYENKSGKTLAILASITSH